MIKRIAEKAGRRLWKWLGDNPGKKKYEWPEWDRAVKIDEDIYLYYYNGEEVNEGCFLCAYYLDCSNGCPLSTGDDSPIDDCNAFNKWYQARKRKNKKGMVRWARRVEFAHVGMPIRKKNN